MDDPNPKAARVAQCLLVGFEIGTLALAKLARQSSNEATKPTREVTDIVFDVLASSHATAAIDC